MQHGSRTPRIRAIALPTHAPLVAFALLLLLAAVAWLAFTRLAPSHATAIQVEPAIALEPYTDAPYRSFVVPEPTAPLVAERVQIAVPDVDATDWAALSSGVATIGVAPAAIASSAQPAELATAMSDRERRALLASVRTGEPEGLPGPQGYRPGIAVIVPGGSMSDGVCR